MMTNASVPRLDLKKILSTAQLPGLPQSAIRLLELSQDSTNGPAEFAVPIEVDPGLTGQVLKFVNSSYFGFAREISSVRMAITLVGIRTIKNFALWSAVFSLMANPRCGPFDVFAAALLQDMAIPILAKESPQLYTKLLESRKQGQFRLSAIENQIFGWTHAQAAAMMTRHWNLPDDFADLIENHITIEKFADQPKEAPDKLAVSMSALLPTIADPLWTECQQFESYYDKITPDNSPTIIELLSQIDTEFDRFAPVMKLSTPAKSLVDRYNEVTASTI